MQGCLRSSNNLPSSHARGDGGKPAHASARGGQWHPPGLSHPGLPGGLPGQLDRMAGGLSGIPDRCSMAGRTRNPAPRSHPVRKMSRIRDTFCGPAWSGLPAAFPLPRCSTPRLLRNACGVDRPHSLGSAATAGRSLAAVENITARRAALVANGVPERTANNAAGSGRGPWRLARSRALSLGLSNAHFRSLGLLSLFGAC